MAKTFKELYCAHFGITEREYAQTLLIKAVYPFSSPITSLLLRCYPQWFELDFIILKKLGNSTSFSQFQEEAEKVAFRYRRAQDYTFLRRFFKVRLSSRRLLRMAVLLWKSHLESSRRLQ